MASWTVSIAALRARLREVLPDLRRHLLEGLYHLGLDIGDADDHGAEPPGTGALTTSFASPNAAVGYRLVQHFGLGEGSEFEIARCNGPLGRDRLEGRAFLDLGGGGVGFGLRRERDLLDRAALWRAEFRLFALVGGAGIRIRDRLGLGQRRGIDREDRDRAEFGRLEGGLAIVVEALQLLGGRGRDLARHLGRQQEIGGGAALVGVAVEGVLRRDRDRQIACDGLGQMDAGHGAPLFAQEAGLRSATHCGAPDRTARG